MLGHWYFGISRCLWTIQRHGTNLWFQFQHPKTDRSGHTEIKPRVKWSWSERIKKIWTRVQSSCIRMQPRTFCLTWQQLRCRFVCRNYCSGQSRLWQSHLWQWSAIAHKERMTEKPHLRNDELNRDTIAEEKKMFGHAVETDGPVDSRCTCRPRWTPPLAEPPPPSPALTAHWPRLAPPPTTLRHVSRDWTALRTCLNAAFGIRRPKILKLQQKKNRLKGKPVRSSK